MTDLTYIFPYFDMQNLNSGKNILKRNNEKKLKRLIFLFLKTNYSVRKTKVYGYIAWHFFILQIVKPIRTLKKKGHTHTHEKSSFKKQMNGLISIFFLVVLTSDTTVDSPGFKRNSQPSSHGFVPLEWSQGFAYNSHDEYCLLPPTVTIGLKS